jgi:hypothetical protein
VSIFPSLLGFELGSQGAKPHVTDVGSTRSAPALPTKKPEVLNIVTMQEVEDLFKMYDCFALYFMSKV